MNAFVSLDCETLRRTLAATILRHVPTPGRWKTALDGVTLLRRDAPTEPGPCFYEAALTLVAQGVKTISMGARTIVYDQAHALLTAVDVPVLSRVARASRQAPFLAISLRLDMQMAADMLAQTEAPPQDRQSVPALSVEPISMPLLEAMVRLVHLLDTPQDIPVLQPLYAQETLYRLLCSPHREALQRMASADGRLRRVGRAIDWLKRHYAEPCRIEALAQNVGMSVSALHHHFKAATAQSPLQFQKCLRLQHAKRLIATGNDIAEACYAVGYQSPSHFSRDYRRWFGAAPSRDSTP